jgi:hypothetical protein
MYTICLLFAMVFVYIFALETLSFFLILPHHRIGRFDTRVSLHVIGSIFLSVKRLGVKIRRMEREFFFQSYQKKSKTVSGF